MDDYLTLVVENGSGWIKAGFAGGDTMRALFPSVVGKPLINGATKKDYYVGDEALHQRENLKIKYPIQRGTITNWDDMEKIWHHTFYNELRVAPEEHPIILTETPGCDNKQRETMAQIMFETFNVPFLYATIPAVLCLYCHSRGDVATVLDVGFGATHATSIYYGHAIQHSIQTLDLAGNDLTDYLQTMLAKKGHQFSAEMMGPLNDMKERLGYVALDYEKEKQQAKESSALEKTYDLPDGKQITLSSERFEYPEALFRPSLLGKEAYGVHEMVYKSIMQSDVDIQKELFGNIILCGSSSLYPGMAARLEHELGMLAPSGSKIKVANPQKYSAYIGGSILGSMSTFQKMWISRQEYDETGSVVILRKCF